MVSPSLKLTLPSFGILTTNTYKQALKRAQQKGVEIADTTILSINTYMEIKSTKS